MIRICFAGVTGWTAPPILAAIDAAPDLALVAGVSRSAPGQSLSSVARPGRNGAVHATVADALAATAVDVLVDYTSADAVKDNVWTAVGAGAHTVVGSSGLAAADYAELDRFARARGAGVVAAGNFSIQAAVLQHAAKTAAGHLDRWEIIDYASAEKSDVPSGTARQLAEAVGVVRAPAPEVPLADLIGRVEARGTDVAGARVHSVRLPSFVVSTEIIFGGAGEKLFMRHEAGETANPYVKGTLLAIRSVAEQPGVRLGMDSLLFE